VNQLLVAAMICLLAIPAPASAQRRRRTPTKRKPAPTAPAVVDTSAKDRSAAARRVADQVKTLSQFLYLLGGVTKTVQAADVAARESKSPEAIALADRNKAGVRDSIRNVQVGLDQLETEFSGKSTLRPYYHLMIGASDLAGTASRQAEAGDFEQAGRSLLRALERLTDVLVAMQQAPAA
jgi:hypothetical protein